MGGGMGRHGGHYENRGGYGGGRGPSKHGQHGGYQANPAMSFNNYLGGLGVQMQAAQGHQNAAVQYQQQQLLAAYALQQQQQQNLLLQQQPGALAQGQAQAANDPQKLASLYGNNPALLQQYQQVYGAQVGAQVTPTAGATQAGVGQQLNQQQLLLAQQQQALLQQYQTQQPGGAGFQAQPQAGTALTAGQTPVAGTTPANAADPYSAFGAQPQDAAAAGDDKAQDNTATAKADGKEDDVDWENFKPNEDPGQQNDGDGATLGKRGAPEDGPHELAHTLANPAEAALEAQDTVTKVT